MPQRQPTPEIEAALVQGASLAGLNGVVREATLTTYLAGRMAAGQRIVEIVPVVQAGIVTYLVVTGSGATSVERALDTLSLQAQASYYGNDTAEPQGAMSAWTRARIQADEAAAREGWATGPSR